MRVRFLLRLSLFFSPFSDVFERWYFPLLKTDERERRWMRKRKNVQNLARISARKSENRIEWPIAKSDWRDERDERDEFNLPDTDEAQQPVGLVWVWTWGFKWPTRRMTMMAVLVLVLVLVLVTIVVDGDCFWWRTETHLAIMQASYEVKDVSGNRCQYEPFTVIWLLVAGFSGHLSGQGGRDGRMGTSAPVELIYEKIKKKWNHHLNFLESCRRPLFNLLPNYAYESVSILVLFPIWNRRVSMMCSMIPIRIGERIYCYSDSLLSESGWS